MNGPAARARLLVLAPSDLDSRALDDVKKDMQRWHDLYPLDGLFVDELANQSAATLLDYYAELLRYARELDPAYRLVGNSGANTDELYLKRPTSDVIVLFENNTGYATFTRAAWTKRGTQSGPNAT